MIGNNDFRFDVALQKEFEHEENKSVEQELFKVDPGHEYG